MLAASGGKRLSCCGKRGHWEVGAERITGAVGPFPEASAALPLAFCKPHLALRERSCFLFARTTTARCLCLHSAFPVHLPFEQKCF